MTLYYFILYYGNCNIFCHILPHFSTFATFCYFCHFSHILPHPENSNMCFKYPDLICRMDSFENKNYIRNFHDLIPVMLTNDSSKLPWILHAGESIKSINYNLLDGLLIWG